MLDFFPASLTESHIHFHSQICRLQPSTLLLRLLNSRPEISASNCISIELYVRVSIHVTFMSAFIRCCRFVRRHKDPEKTTQWSQYACPPCVAYLPASEKLIALVYFQMLADKEGQLCLPLSPPSNPTVSIPLAQADIWIYNERQTALDAKRKSAAASMVKRAVKSWNSTGCGSC